MLSYGRRLNRFPDTQPFLKPDPVRVARYREKLQGDDDNPLIGISWRSANPLAGPDKSTDLVLHWRPLLEQEGVRFICLQYGDVSDELEALQKQTGCEIVNDPTLDPTRDVDGFAALVASMDLVISTSNTTVHVAGGLGIPTWTLLPSAYGRPWYWFDRGGTAPWYPGVRLYRSNGDWTALIAQVAQELLQWNDK